MRTPLLLALLFAAPAARAAEPPAAFPFQPGNRVLFLGDSITEQYQYSSYVELYLTTRFPQGKMFFLNAGIGGDTANGGAARFASHVLAEKPDVVTINFGMNDGGYGGFDAGRAKQFAEKTAAMLDAAKKAGVRVVLMSPNAVDPRLKTNGAQYVETQKQFYAPLQELAAKHGAAFVDQYAVTRAAQDRMAIDDPKAAKARPYYDGFHTSPPGAMLMAHAILTGLRAPALVSRVEIDGEKVSATGANVGRHTITKAGEVRFERTDEALPLPVQKDWLQMLPYTNGLRDLNRYELAVKGLPAGTYAVQCDGVEMGRHTAEELAAGVDYGTKTEGPLWSQGQDVFLAINAKNKIVHDRFRNVVMSQIPAWLADVAKERKPRELQQRMALVAAEQAKAYELAQPKARVWTIAPLAPGAK